MTFHPVYCRFQSFSTFIAIPCNIILFRDSNKRDGMKKTGIVLFVLIFSLISVSCNRKQNDPQKEEVVVQPGIVQDYADEMKRSYNFISKPYRSTDLSFRVSGPVLYFNAQNGQFFRKGELIAAIDERDFRIRCEHAKAVYERAKGGSVRFTRQGYRGENRSFPVVSK